VGPFVTLGGRARSLAPMIARRCGPAPAA